MKAAVAATRLSIKRCKSTDIKFNHFVFYNFYIWTNGEVHQHHYQWPGRSLDFLAMMWW